MYITHQYLFFASYRMLFLLRKSPGAVYHNKDHERDRDSQGSSPSTEEEEEEETKTLLSGKSSLAPNGHYGSSKNGEEDFSPPTNPAATDV